MRRLSVRRLASGLVQKPPSSSKWTVDLYKEAAIFKTDPSLGLSPTTEQIPYLAADIMCNLPTTEADFISGEFARQYRKALDDRRAAIRAEYHAGTVTIDEFETAIHDFSRAEDRFELIEWRIKDVLDPKVRADPSEGIEDTFAMGMITLFGLDANTPDHKFKFTAQPSIEFTYRGVAGWHSKPDAKVVRTTTGDIVIVIEDKFDGGLKRVDPLSPSKHYFLPQVLGECIAALARNWEKGQGQGVWTGSVYALRFYDQYVTPLRVHVTEQDAATLFTAPTKTPPKTVQWPKVVMTSPLPETSVGYDVTKQADRRLLFPLIARLRAAL